MQINAGIAALPTILLLGGLIVEIAIAATLSAFLFVNTEFGIRLSNDAFVAAQSGMHDALMKIVRDKNFNSSFTLVVGNNSVDVAVCKDICLGIGKDKITALGKAQARRRQLEASVNVNSLTGEVRLEYLKEVSL